MKNLIVRTAASFRDHKYKVLLTAAVVVLAAANISLLARPTSRSVQVQAEAVIADEAAVKETGNIKTIKSEVPLPLPGADAMTYNLPFANCIYDLRFRTLPSTVFKSSPYQTSFIMADSSSNIMNGFYDINGDNLPDYVYTHSSAGEGTTDIYGAYNACVYLHNGTGWTKAYVCSASYILKKETGTVYNAVYYGDCAQF